MTLNPIIKAIVVINLVLAAVGCAIPKATTVSPKGFAEYKDSEEFKAVSPEGVVYRVRTEPNKPFADLTFWKEAFKKRMIDAGYEFQTESTITANNQEGYLLELTTPLSQKDYTCLTAIFVTKDTITIIESAGDVLHLKSRRQDILAAIERVVFAD